MVILVSVPPPLESEREGQRMRKHLTTIANDVIERCAQILDTSADALVSEFGTSLKPVVDNYSRRLVEFCCVKALENLTADLANKISDGSFSRFTYDMMLAWERPRAIDEEPYSEGIAKEKEDKKEPLQGNEGQMHDDILLFYTDIMPLLVNEEPSVGEDAYVWFGSILPLASDVVNARFNFETLTAPTANKLHFPGYDRFLKEMDKCLKHLQRQSTPTDSELEEDEFILHVEGTARTQRVVRHIGASSWPGRLTLTNKALYFEASGVISYEPALKIDLSKAEVDHQVKSALTGPWGAPLFDKAITYESSQLSEPLVLEFPEMTSSTRRDHWLSLIKEIILLHRFLSKFDIESPVQAWEAHSRAILGILRLHAAREMLRISPPAPTNFMIFSLYDDLHKGDYVLEELANNLKQTSTVTPCSATSVLKSLGMSHPMASSMEMKQVFKDESSGHAESLASLETTIDQVREEAKEVTIAKATVEEMKEEGITDGLLILVGLLSPLRDLLVWIQRIISWERPAITICTLSTALLIIYKEGVGYALATFLMIGVGTMLWARRRKMGDKCSEVVIDTSTDKTTMENIVNAQHNLTYLNSLVKTVNVTILKLWSVMLSKAPKHTDMAMLAMSGLAVVVAVIPFKYILMGLTLFYFLSSSGIAKSTSGSRGNRRLKEWWESIPIVPVRIIGNPT